MTAKTIIKTTNIDKCNNCGSHKLLKIAKSKDFEYLSCENDFIHVKCGVCGLVFLRNRPAVSTLNIIYPPNYRPHDFKKVLKPFVAKARDLVQKRKVNIIKKYAPKNAFVIDVGCGNGTLLNLMRKCGDPSWRLGGVDIAPDAIDVVQKMGMKGYLGRFESMTWDDDLPDVIVMNQVIEHLENPYAVVKKAYELLRPGGYFIVETPSVEGWDAKWFGKRYWGGWHTPRHWTLYNEKTLSFLFKRVGLDIIETNYLLSPTFWLKSLHHYFTERHYLKILASMFDNRFLPSLILASGFDFVQLLFRSKTSNFRMVGHKRLKLSQISYL